VKYKMSAFRHKADMYPEQEPYPWFGMPFKGEVGHMIEPDEWMVRYYMIFLFKRCWGIEVNKTIGGK
jgi:hypothetical protein